MSRPVPHQRTLTNTVTTLLILTLIAATVWAWNRHRHTRTGAGTSAARRARQLRTPLVRVATAVGIRTRAEQRARRFEAGAAGEKRTGKLIDPLSREGWTILHDRGLPGTRANVDHLAISPGGAVFMPDTKHWSARYPITIRNGRLWHGTRDVTDRLDGLFHEQKLVAKVLGAPVVPIIAMHGAPLHTTNGHHTHELKIHGVRIVPADRLPNVLRASHRPTTTFRAAGHIPGQRTAAELAHTAQRALPPYAKR